MPIVDEIIAWSKSLPYWEQFALFQIFTVNTITDDIRNQIFRYLLEDNGLEIMKGTRLELWKDFHLDETESVAEKIILKAMKKTSDINALVPNQTLEFSPNLTIIYGDNASGKSGYARLLSSCGFIRRKNIHVLTDVTKPFNASVHPSAELVVQMGEELITYNYSEAVRQKELSMIYAFDNESSMIHLSEKNEISLVPTSLQSLTRLSEIVDKVKSSLQDLIKQKTVPNKYIDIFQGESDIKPKIENLSSDTDLYLLKELSRLNGKEQEQLKTINTKIATQQFNKTIDRIKELVKIESELSSIVKKAKATIAKVDNSVLKSIISQINSYNEAQRMKKQFGSDQFKNDMIQSVGTDQWIKLIKEARLLAIEEEQKRDNEYPAEGDVCLLCQQPLTIGTIEFLKKLWGYLEDANSKIMDKLKSEFNEKIDKLKKIDLDFNTDHLKAIHYLLSSDKSVYDLFAFSVKSQIIRRDEIVNCMENTKLTKFTPLELFPYSQIELIIGKTKEEIEVLRKTNTSKEIEKLEKEKTTILHRILLNKYLDEIKLFVLDLVWLANARKVSISTRHITQEYDRLFTKVVSEKYEANFNKILEIIGGAFSISIETIPGKARTSKRIKLEIDDSHNSKEITIDKVLSDGEKKAVAFCDYLAEVQSNDNYSCIVLDDPVTSLDLQWRNRFAEILVEISKSTQVIVFTHDVIFWYMLSTDAKQNGVKYRTHIIERGISDNDRPGYVFLDNNPESNDQYANSNIARKYLEEGRESEPEQRNEKIRLGFDALRRGYEVIFENKILKKSIKRWKPNISVERLADVKWDQEKVNLIIEKHREVSRYIGSHSQPDDSPFPKATIEILEESLNEYDKIRSK